MQIAIGGRRSNLHSEWSNCHLLTIAGDVPPVRSFLELIVRPSVMVRPIWVATSDIGAVRGDSSASATKGHPMTEIQEHMEVIGADGVHVGTVDKIEGNRIKLTKKDSGEGSHKGHHHFIDKSLVAEVEGDKVRLSAVGAVAVTMEQEK